MSTEDGFQRFDSIAEKRHDKLKIFSIILNIVFLIVIIAFSLILTLILTKQNKNASAVNTEQIIPILSSYYPNKIEGAASLTLGHINRHLNSHADVPK